MNKKIRVVAIIQARYGSTRLPGKVLLDLAGQPVLVRVVERTRHAGTLDEVVVATSTQPQDDQIVRLCQERGYAFFRGNLYDVLDRYYQAASNAQADIVVRITADCPVIDPGLIDETVRLLLDDSLNALSEFDFAATRLPPPWKRTYPIGLDVEACTFATLHQAWQKADQPYQREHVMPYIYDGVTLQPQTPKLHVGISAHGYRIAILQYESDYGALRWAVDTAEDLTLMREIYARFDGRDDFGWEEILALWEREPQLGQINAHVRHKTLHDVEKPTK